MMLLLYVVPPYLKGGRTQGSTTLSNKTVHSMGAFRFVYINSLLDEDRKYPIARENLLPTVTSEISPTCGIWATLGLLVISRIILDLQCGETHDEKRERLWISAILGDKAPDDAVPDDDTLNRLKMCRMVLNWHVTTAISLTMDIVGACYLCCMWQYYFPRYDMPATVHDLDPSEVGSRAMMWIGCLAVFAAVVYFWYQPARLHMIRHSSTALLIAGGILAMLGIPYCMLRTVDYEAAQCDKRVEYIANVMNVNQHVHTLKWIAYFVGLFLPWIVKNPKDMFPDAWLTFGLVAMDPGGALPSSLQAAKFGLDVANTTELYNCFCIDWAIIYTVAFTFLVLGVRTMMYKDKFYKQAKKLDYMWDLGNLKKKVTSANEWYDLNEMCHVHTWRSLCLSIFSVLVTIGCYCVLTLRPQVLSLKVGFCAILLITKVAASSTIYIATGLLSWVKEWSKFTKIQTSKVSS